MQRIFPAAGRYLASHNCSSRDGHDVALVVIHYTGGSNGRRSAAWMRRGSARRAPHFVGFRDGGGEQLVPVHLSAWHAGSSAWSGTYGCNRISIGIELANHGLLHRDGDRFLYECAGNLYRYRGPDPIRAELELPNGVVMDGWWEPYTDAQLDWLERLLDDLRRAHYEFEVVGHEEIAVPVGRKTDPGACFPWWRFRAISSEPPAPGDTSESSPDRPQSSSSGGAVRGP